MCHASCIIFGAMNIDRDEIRGKRIVEVGSLCVNGSLRSIVESYKPSEYVGVDIAMGPGVDVQCDVSELVSIFGENSFDYVISTEMLEHVRDWRLAVSNIKRICKQDGHIVLTTRSKGFVYHAYPYDFWRWELEDFEMIFSDFEIEKLESDPLAPGVFLKAKKPSSFSEVDLRSHQLYSILLGRKVTSLESEDLSKYYRRLKLDKVRGDLHDLKKDIFGLF